MDTASISDNLFANGGEMGARMRQMNWSNTLLGDVSGWSSSLKTAVSICLNSRFPMVIWWSKELVLLYNDAWRPILGTKHPNALGKPGKEVWSEIWDIIGTQLNSVLDKAQATWSDDMLLLVDRYGYTEEAYFTYSYSPILLDTGEVGGAFTAVTETTRRVVGERRLRTLRELAANTGEAKSVEEACQIASTTLANNPYDLPFTLLYLVDGTQAQLSGAVGLEAGTLVSAERVDLTQTEDCWKFAEVMKTGEAEVVNQLSQFGLLLGGAWGEPSRSAVVLPIAQSGQKHQLVGFLVLGVSPRLEFDDEYRGFFDLVTSNVATAIGNAQAYEEERKRAEALAELDRAKTAFFSNVSHEFRTPLTLMLGPLENTLSRLDGHLPPEDRFQLQMVQRNGQRLLKLVNSLLDFSRIEAGRIQAVYQPTDLAQYTAELAAVFRSAIEQANLRLVINCPSLSVTAWIDREMWEKIVLNLISNAFKFTFKGEISVTLREKDDRIELEVSDTGTGIPDDELPEIFKRFHRVRGAKGRSYEGSGIGLSLVQELVNLHQGMISVSSVIDRGTSFVVSIPTGSAHLPQERLDTTRTLVSTATGAAPYVEEVLRWISTDVAETVDLTESGQVFPIVRSNQPSAQILLVDDNEDMRDYAKRLLTSLGYTVKTVADGRMALTAVRQQVPDLVLTDVMMPNLDGFGLLHELRSDPNTRDIPIILLSARAGEEARIEGLAAGADDYLIKPFSARELLARVEANLKLSQLRREAMQQEQVLRQEAEAAHQQVETILSSINDGFYALDLDWRFIYVNKRYCEMVGMQPAEILGQNVWELFPAAVDTEADVQFHQAIVEQTPRQFEYLYTPWNCWHDHRIYPSPTGLTVFLADITDRKRTELNEQFLNHLDQRLRQLSAAEAMVREAIRSLGDYLKVDRCLWDRINWATGMAIVEQDWHPQEVPSLVGTYPLSNFVLPELADLLHSGQPAVVSDVTIDSHTAPFADNFIALDIRAFVGVPCVYDGCWVATLVVNARTTRSWRSDEVALLQEFVARLWSLIERTKAVEELHQSEAELRHLANTMPQIVWISRADGFLEFVNDRWTEYTGLSLEQSRDRTQMEQVIPAEDQQQLNAEFIHAQATRSPYQSQFRLIQPNGKLRYFLARAMPIQDEQGQIRKWYGTSTDITELKQLETERSQLLVQEQATREAAERANRIKDEFLAVLSHELRSPLNPILGWARLLKTGNLNAAKTVQAITTIERNAKLQSELIEDLLDVSRILQGKLSLKVSPVDLASTIRAAIETVHLSAEAKSITVEVNLDAEVGQVSGDSTRLQQVVWNLLSNAVKFTPIGGRVEVRLVAVEHQAEITVSDTGKGIPAGFLPHVFDYFRQEDGATTRQFGGLGLGLAIVRHLVELHGGAVQVESPGEGLGSTFTVKLPLMPIPTIVRLDPPSSQAPLNLAGVQVLVIDDETDSREFVAFVLEQAEATVTTASTASEGFLALTQSPPDVLLSDIGMPDMDGYMLMQQVRALPPEQGGQVRAIALTAYAGDFNHQQALQAGFQHHLSKPVEPEELVDAIIHLLGRS